MKTDQRALLCFDDDVIAQKHRRHFDSLSDYRLDRFGLCTLCRPTTQSKRATDCMSKSYLASTVLDMFRQIDCLLYLLM